MYQIKVVDNSDISKKTTPLYWIRFVFTTQSDSLIEEGLAEYGGKRSVTDTGDKILTFETEEQFTFFVLRWS